MFRLVIALVLVCMARPVLSQESPPPPSTWAPAPQERNPCDGITCSSHGNCVVTGRGSPTCACFNGFTPDTVNGLSCVPIGNPQRVRQNNYQRREPPVDSVASLTMALDGYDVSGFRKKWLKEKHAGSFSSYLIHEFDSKKTGGAVMIFLGILVWAGSAGMYVYGAKDDEMVGIAMGVVFDILGTVLVISGAVSVSVNNVRVNKLKRYQASIRFSRWRFEHVGPLVSETGIPEGLAARFSF